MKIINAKVFTPAFTFTDKDICVLHEKFSGDSLDNCVVDANGLYAIPGLIDIHFHGAVGCDFRTASWMIKWQGSSLYTFKAARVE